jgi:hypothetical protein
MTSATLLCAACTLFGAAFINILYRIEKKLPYEKEKSRDKPPENAMKC